MTATETSSSRMMFIASAPLTVPCPRCKAAYGSQCRSSGDYTVGFHAARMKAVAHLSDDERYEAFAALRAEQAQTRTDVQAHMARMDADPVYVAERNATRTAFNEAWDEINRQVWAEERAARVGGQS